jgi:Thioredoxin-like
MKSAALIFLAATLLACSSSTLAEPPVPAVPEFDGNSLTRALSVADQTGRNVFVEYSSPDCPFSRKMWQTTMVRPEVKELMKDVVYVRIRKNSNPGAFEARWGERNTPTFLVLKPDGSEVGPIVTGLVKTSDFERYVAWAKTGEGPEPAFRTGGS